MAFSKSARQRHATQRRNRRRFSGGDLSEGEQKAMRSRRLTWVHANDAGEGFLGVLQTAIAVVENANAVPQLRLLQQGQESAEERVGGGGAGKLGKGGKKLD